jgi:hypothetical protein
VFLADTTLIVDFGGIKAAFPYVVTMWTFDIEINYVGLFLILTHNHDRNNNNKSMFKTILTIYKERFFDAIMFGYMSHIVKVIVLNKTRSESLYNNVVHAPFFPISRRKIIVQVLNNST